ncbi:MAG: TnsA endonuclease N-terminal domain-containing protein [Bacillota bacterium]
MARTRVLNTISTVERKLKEGRGQGVGKEYLPWITVYEVPSHGRARKIKGWKTQREHHLLSDHERRYFFILDWSSALTDIREQFPLLPVEEVQEIAQRKGISYPVDIKTREHIVMTTDFRITLNDGSEVLRSVKPIADLNSQRTIEK